METTKNKEFILFKIIKKVKLKTIILLIVFLSFNSYAWFIYATKVSSGISAHITSWNVKFRAGEKEVTTNVVFEVDKIYPGMEPQMKTLTAYNVGEMKALLKYNIRTIRILDETYTVSETFTQDKLIEKLNEYPFKLTFAIDNTNLDEENGSADFDIKLVWNFESGDDALDTKWGEMAYEYNKNHPSSSSIYVEVDVSATQHEV